MPRWVRMKLKSARGARSLILLTRSRRMRLMRSRIAPSSCSHWARSSGEASTAVTSWLPWPGEFEAVRLRVVVGIAAHREAGGFEELAVVFPARLADPDFGVRRDQPEEIGSDLQAAGAAEGLDRDDALFLKAAEALSEEQLLYRAVVGRQAIDRQVAARRRGPHALTLGATYALDERHLAVIVVIDADAEVHFLRIRIGNVGLGDAENRIARRHGHPSKQRGGMRGVHRLKCRVSRCNILPWPSRFPIVPFGSPSFIRPQAISRRRSPS